MIYRNIIQILKLILPPDLILNSGEVVQPRRPLVVKRDPEETDDVIVVGR